MPAPSAALTPDRAAALRAHLGIHGALTQPELRAVCGHPSGVQEALAGRLIALQETLIGPLAFPARLADLAPYVRSPSAATNSAYLRLAFSHHRLPVEVAAPERLGMFTHPASMPTATYQDVPVIVGGKAFGDGVSKRNVGRYFAEHSLFLRDHELALLLIAPEVDQYRNARTRGAALLLLRYAYTQAVKDNT
ncbi:hypothetical protein [Deinococcus petrolearius]|uniref:Uncharacterized protein n=1 Tax=Deinococcus petrolearius TaxID=1751295 RepID=A0ABW1DPA9_9DEIO